MSEPKAVAELPERKILDREGMIQKATLECGDIIEQLGQTLLDGVARTNATEGAHIQIRIAYNPKGTGGKKLKVSGGLSVPAKGFEHEVIVKDGEDGDVQLSMYDD